MILYRHNGEAICLTPEEMREIHQEVERANMIEDIQARLEDMELPEAGPSELTLIVGIAERLLPHNEPYFDAYVNRYLSDGGKLPTNLSIVFSAWGDEFKPYNPHNLPVAYIRLKKEDCTIPEEAYECSGFCGQCAATSTSCWNLKRGESVVFNQH